MLYITGATGHSGRWFLKALNEHQYSGKIRCVVRDSSDLSAFEGLTLDIDLLTGNLNDEEFLDRSLEGVDTVVHISSITLSEKLIKSAIKNHVQWAILVHTTGRFSRYKSASEEYILIEDGILQQRNQIDITVLRPTMIYGSSRDRNMYRLVEYLATHRFFPLFGSGRNLMQPVHAMDLGNAYYQVLMHESVTRNREYDLSGKEPITYLEIIKTILSQLNRKLLLIPIPISLSILAAKAYNALFQNAIITVEQVMRMQEDKAFSHQKAGQDFGYDPLSFEQGIKEEIKEFQSGVRVDYSNTKYA